MKLSDLISKLEEIEREQGHADPVVYITNHEIGGVEQVKGVRVEITKSGAVLVVLK